MELFLCLTALAAGDTAAHGATLERQAIGRAVRMGQTRKVTVVRFEVRRCRLTSRLTLG